jgi:hypothetical protein
VYQNTNKLKDVFFAPRGIAEVLNGIRSHVDFVGKRKVIVDLAPLHRSKVELKTLQMEYKMVRQILETGSLDRIDMAIAS